MRGALRKKHWVGTAAFGLVILLLLAVLMLSLLTLYNETAAQRQQADCAALLDATVAAVNKSYDDYERLVQNFNQMNQSMLTTLGSLFQSGQYSRLGAMDAETRSGVFLEWQERLGAEALYLTDGEGVVLLGGRTDDTGRKLSDMIAADGDLSDTLLICRGDAEGTKTSAQGESPDVLTPLVDTKSGAYWYSTPVFDKADVFSGQYLVMRHGSDILRTERENMLMDVSFGRGGVIFISDVLTKTLLINSEGVGNFAGRSLTEAGLTEALLEDGYTGTQRINGAEYFCVSKSAAFTSGKLGSCIATAAIPLGEMLGDRNFFIGCTAIAFVTVVWLMTHYTHILRANGLQSGTAASRTLLRLGARRLVFRRGLMKKLVPIWMLGSLLILLVSLYLQSLLPLSNTIVQTNVYMQDVQVFMDGNLKTYDTVSAYYNAQMQSKSSLIAEVLEQMPESVFQFDPDSDDVFARKADDGTVKLDAYQNAVYAIRSAPALCTLSNENQLHAIYVFDEDGDVIATNTPYWYYSLGAEEGDASYAYRSILSGKIDALVQRAGPDEQGRLMQYVGCKFYYYTRLDEAGGTVFVPREDYEAQLAQAPDVQEITRHRGVVELGVSPELLGAISDTTSLESALTQVHLEKNGFAVLFADDGAHTVLYAPPEKDIGKTAAEMGVGDKAFSGDYSGFQRIDGIRYFQHYTSLSDISGDRVYVAATLPAADIYETRAAMSLLPTLLGAALLLLLALSLCLGTELAADAPPPVAAPAAGKSPEQRLTSMIKGCGIALCGLALLGMLHLLFSGQNIVVLYILSGTWDRGLNIFALTACGLLLAAVALLSDVLRLLIRMLTRNMDTRAETICQLLCSVVKYGAALAALFSCMYLVGMDPGSLLASAGILTVVVGLGAQSLIGDILAGMFIVFEGAFRVGDIVTVEDFRGQVVELGLRTTKIRDMAQGNIKIYNNSTLKAVLNMTKGVSTAVCNLYVRNDEPLERLEEVFARELPALSEKLPDILGAPVYCGVTGLQEACKTITVTAACSERDRLKVNAQLSREALLILERNGIRLPE